MAAPDLLTAIGRIRFAVGDLGETSLLPDGETQIADLLTFYGGAEATTYLAVASALLIYLEHDPTTLKAGDDSVTYTRARLKAIAEGRVPYPFTSTASASTAFSVDAQRTDGYTTSGSEYV